MKKMENYCHKILRHSAVIICIILFSLISCEEDDTIDVDIIEISDNRMDLTPFKREDAGVMMQAFYWDVEPIGEWYNTVSLKIEDWAEAGVNRIWLPPPGKGASGSFSMGYDPSDYFDVGEFDQHFTVKTRFGSRSELVSLINKAHDLNLEVIADIVMGHNSGGGLQENPFRQDDSDEVFTLFNPMFGNASGKFNRDFNHFHPNEIHENDRVTDFYLDNPEHAQFFPETDICHDQPYVQDWLWNRDDSVAEFYKNEIGFDGWRFDYVKSFDPKWVKQWNEKVGGFSVGENFDGNADVLRDWVTASGSPAFDFAMFFKLDETLDRNGDLTALGDENNMLRKSNPNQAVTFVANHDTEKDENPDSRISYANKLLAYAYMLTHDGYPTIFYLDYENPSFKDKIKGLIEIHNSLATGTIEILAVNADEYIMKRSGDDENPGLVLYMNISDRTRQFEITNTSWSGQTLVDYTGNESVLPKVSGDGKVTIQTKGKSYAIYSLAKADEED